MFNTFLVFILSSSFKKKRQNSLFYLWFKFFKMKISFQKTFSCLLLFFSTSFNFCICQEHPFAKSEYLQYMKNKTQAVNHFYLNEFESSIKSFEKAFEFDNYSFFDNYYYALCLLKTNEFQNAKDYFLKLVAKGYPVESLLKNKDLEELFKSNPELTNQLSTSKYSDFTSANFDLFHNLKKRAELDSKTRENCPLPDCDEWLNVTKNNIQYLADYVTLNGIPCEKEIGFGTQYLNFILLHGKSIKDFEKLNELLKEAVVNGCFPAENYAYWVDGNMTNIFEKEEVYGTISLAMYRYSLEPIDELKIINFNKKREEIGLETIEAQLEFFNKKLSLTD